MREENRRERMTLCNYPTSECKSGCCSWAKCWLCLAKAGEKKGLARTGYTVSNLFQLYRKKWGSSGFLCSHNDLETFCSCIPGDKSLHDITAPKSTEKIPTLLLWHLYQSEMQDWAWWHATDGTHSGVLSYTVALPWGLLTTHHGLGLKSCLSANTT